MGTEYNNNTKEQKFKKTYVKIYRNVCRARDKPKWDSTWDESWWSESDDVVDGNVMISEQISESL